MTTVVASISTTDGSLTLTSAPYEILGAESTGGSGLDIGQVQFSRVWATSAYVAGGVQVLSIPGMVSATLKMYVYDTSQANVQTDLATLIEAFTQDTYTLTFEVGDATYEWTCYNADYQIDPWPLIAVIPTTPRLGVTFDIPRSPVPLQGPI